MDYKPDKLKLEPKIAQPCQGHLSEQSQQYIFYATTKSIVLTLNFKTHKFYNRLQNIVTRNMFLF